MVSLPKPLLIATLKELTPARLRVLRKLSEGGALVRYSRTIKDKSLHKACKVYLHTAEEEVPLPNSIWCWLRDFGLIRLENSNFIRSVWRISNKGLEVLKVCNDNSVFNETVF